MLGKLGFTPVGVLVCIMPEWDRLWPVAAADTVSDDEC